jgi:membrane fusion protein (multidrug efflux system)
MHLAKRLSSFLVAASLTVSLTASLAALLSGCGQSTQASTPPPSAEPEVTVATIAPQQLTLTTVLAGRTSAFLVAEVRPQVSGIVQKRLFQEGSEVKAGEVLYQIDPSTYQAAYNSAKAALAKAEANARPARLKGERFSALAQSNAVSVQDNDDAQAAHRQAEAEVVAARAALEAARINLSYTRVSAPIAGRIGKSAVTPGALVTASQATPLSTIQQTNPIYVDVTQSSGEVMRLKRDLASGKLKKSADGGAKVKLLLEDGTPYATEGTLQFSDITVDQSTGVITLRAVFPNPGHDLLPGLYVRAVLEEGVEEQAMLAPQTAVSRNSKGEPLVMVVKQDGTVEPRVIEVGRAVGDKWLVTSGLAAGERIIVEGLQKARPGAKVKAVEAAGPAQANAAQANAEQAKPAQVAPAPKTADAAKVQTAQKDEPKPAPRTPETQTTQQPGPKSAQQ